MFSIAFLFALGAAACTTLGLIAVYLGRAWTRTYSGVFAAFAAGALVSIALLHLLPKSIAGSPDAPWLVLAGFAGAYFLNSGVLAFSPSHGHGPAHSHAHEHGSVVGLVPKHHYSAGLIPFFAIAFHSLVDGIAYGVTFNIGFETGVLTVIGLILHEVPEGIIVFTLLQRSGFTNNSALLLAFLGAAATTPIGAAGADLAVGGLGEAGLASLFAVTAGVLLYIGTSHLLPHVDHEPLHRKVPALVLGGLVGLLGYLFHADDHDHGHDHEGRRPGIERPIAE